MPQLRRRFPGLVFSSDALTAALHAFAEERGETAVDRLRLRIDRRQESWKLEHIEDFLVEYARGTDRASVHQQAGKWRFAFAISGGDSVLTVRLKTAAAVRRVLAPLERERLDRPFTVFIGHGRSPQWQALANHLREQHEIHVVSYETLSRFGQPASEVLEAAALSATVALLVHTAELESVDGTRHAVPNVAHETGLFSSRLGTDRAIVIREDSCHPFTNIAGLTQLRFADNNIRETFGDVVAALRRIELNMRNPNSAS